MGKKIQEKKTPLFSSATLTDKVPVLPWISDCWKHWSYCSVPLSGGTRALWTSTGQHKNDSSWCKCCQCAGFWRKRRMCSSIAYKMLVLQCQLSVHAPGGCARRHILVRGHLWPGESLLCLSPVSFPTGQNTQFQVQRKHSELHKLLKPLAVSGYPKTEGCSTSFFPDWIIEFLD